MTDAGEKQKVLLAPDGDWPRLCMSSRKIVTHQETKHLQPCKRIKYRSNLQVLRMFINISLNSM